MDTKLIYYNTMVLTHNACSVNIDVDIYVYDQGGSYRLQIRSESIAEQD